MSAPTVAQLLNLADRAGRKRLSPDEAARLRAGIQHLAEQQPTPPEPERRTP